MFGYTLIKTKDLDKIIDRSLKFEHESMELFFENFGLKLRLAEEENKKPKRDPKTGRFISKK